VEPVINLKMALKQSWWPGNHYRYYDVWDQMKFISHSGKREPCSQKVNKKLLHAH